MIIIKKYLNSIIIVGLWLIGLTLLLTILSYFNIANNTINNYCKIIIPIIAFLSGGWYIGKRSNKRGWLEGLKIGLISLLLFILSSLFIFNTNLAIKNIIYYFILLISTTLGSMIGINKKPS